MNAQMLANLVKALTPDSLLGRLAALSPERGPTATRGSHTKRAHVRAGFTKNHGRGESKTRRNMARMSRQRNRGK